jgi:hypothetical protein
MSHHPPSPVRISLDKWLSRDKWGSPHIWAIVAAIAFVLLILAGALPRLPR